MIMHLIAIGACCFLIVLAGSAMTLTSDRDFKSKWDIREMYAAVVLGFGFAFLYIFLKEDDMGLSGNDITFLVAAKLIALISVAGGSMLGAVHFAFWANQSWTLMKYGISRAEWKALREERKAKEKAEKERERERRD